MNADALLQLYQNDLVEALEGRSRGTAYTIMSHALVNYGAAVLDEQDDRVKVWSDLHIGHANVIRYGNRPFRSVYEMDATLFANWQLGVGDNETIVCVGDMWFGLDFESKPVPQAHQKILVVGNHDLTRGGSLRSTQFDQIYALLLAPGDPPLVFTHVPLPNVPSEFVNVHGHTHQKTPPPESPHINVSVEQLDYQPIALTMLRRLARTIVMGTSPGGSTTLERVQNL